MSQRDYITVVSGAPRSGTSMMMQMLDAGGLPALTDHQRKPDVHNPSGYFEFEPVKSLARNASWMPLARGKAVKIIYRLLWYLPPQFDYRIIFLERDLADVLASQGEMLRARGHSAADQDAKHMLGVFEREIRDTRAWLARQPNMRVLIAPYGEVVAAPKQWTGNVSRFLDGLDENAMAGVIDAGLRHHGA